MKRIALLAVLLLITPATAQEQPFSPIADKDLWEAMQRAFNDLPISLSAHAQIQRIMSDAQREALMRETQRKAKVSETEKK